MKKLLPVFILILVSLSACSGWVYQIPTIAPPPPTYTPIILSPTPLFVTPTITNTVFVTDTATILPTQTWTPTATAFSATATFTPTLTETATSSPPAQGNIVVEVLGCNTSIDITHGMGEVTNAFVTVKNYTGRDLNDVCTTLFALDEGRVHPDKTVCIPKLTNGYQVSLKLTVDSQYKQETPIQVEVTSEGALLSRVGWPSCRDIGLFDTGPAKLKTPIAIP